VLRILLVATLVFQSTYVFSCDELADTGFAPENDSYIPVGLKSGNTMDEKDFNQIIDDVVAIYKKQVANAGGEITVLKDWATGTVNAFACRSIFKDKCPTKKSEIGNNYLLKMFGGLARHPKMTKDGFAIVVCHELGHHIGGAPKKGARWASSEGQSDYWATTKCMKNYLLGAKPVRGGYKKSGDLRSTQALCSAQYKSSVDKDICVRTTVAGQALANVLKSLKVERLRACADGNVLKCGRTYTPRTARAKMDAMLANPLSLLTPDKAVVKTSYNGHPLAQCRYDTFFQGSLCSVDKDAKVDEKDATVGFCNRGKESTGVRPFCWYKPL